MHLVRYSFWMTSKGLKLSLIVFKTFTPLTSLETTFSKTLAISWIFFLNFLHSPFSNCCPLLLESIPPFDWDQNQKVGMEGQKLEKCERLCTVLWSVWEFWKNQGVRLSKTLWNLVEGESVKIKQFWVRTKKKVSNY